MNDFEKLAYYTGKQDNDGWTPEPCKKWVKAQFGARAKFYWRGWNASHRAFS